jgi:hypothetical protein
MSRTTVWRTLAEDAIKPWQYEHWIFPRDPAFGEKARPILDLYAGEWEGQRLGPKDYVLSGDEKTSIQARNRCHTELPPDASQARRVETEYERKGALQYLAFWDVHRGMVLGRCEAKTGIVPFGRLVDDVLARPPYAEAERLFFIVDNGSSHRGKASIQRMRKRQTNLPGSYSGSCQLAQSSGDLLLDHPEKGPDAKRFRRLDGSARAVGPLRGID